MGDFSIESYNYNVDGYVRLKWDNSEEGADWYQWRVYRTPLGEADWELLHSVSTQAATYEFDDYLAPANTLVEYAVVQATSTDGGQTVNEEPYSPTKVVETQDDKYWLIHPTDPTKSVLLHHVTADSMSDEEEHAFMNVIGRGRRMDKGEVWGLTGSLTARFRDTERGTGRDQWQRFLELKRSATHVYLRNPFGDVVKVALSGNPSTEREPGIGISEHHTVTIEYSEVF